MMSPSTLKPSKPAFSNSSCLKSVLAISSLFETANSRPCLRNQVPFSNFSIVVWKGPKILGDFIKFSHRDLEDSAKTDSNTLLFL